MADRQESGTLYKKEIKLPPALGDWTNYRPPKQPQRKIKSVLQGAHRIPKRSLEKTLMVHNHFSIDISKYLKESLKASIDIFNVSIEQLTYLEFLKRVVNGVIYNKININNIGEGMMLIDYQLANIMINFSLGCQSAETKIKELTELEESILQSIFDNLFAKYAQCWGSTFEKPSFEIISYPAVQRETHINLNEVMSVITISISVANSLPATLTFIYQNNILKKMTEILEAKEDKIPLNFSRLPESMLSSVKIPVVAELGSTKIYTREITEIEVDDVLSMDQRLNEPIKLHIGYISEANAQPGIRNNKLVARIIGQGMKRIKSAPVVKVEQPSAVDEEPLTSGPGTRSATGEEFELPIEADEKEEYNPSKENLFEEENDSPMLGGR